MVILRSKTRSAASPEVFLRRRTRSATSQIAFLRRRTPLHSAIPLRIIGSAADTASQEAILRRRT
jgi:hypothetical protein